MATNLAPFLNVFIGDSGSGGTIGLVPAPPAGSAAGGYFLSAGATWSIPSGTGGGVTTVGTLDGGTANANGATITGTTIFLQSASAGFAGAINTGAQTLSGPKTFASPLTALGSMTISGATTVGTTLGVTGATTLSSTLGVTGTATFSGAATVGTTLGVTGATTLSSTLGVTGLITASSGLTSLGNITSSGPIYANGGVRNVAFQTGGTGNITLNINSSPFNYLSQSGNNNVTLTGTSFTFGGGFQLINSTNFTINVLASNAAEIGKILPNSMVQVIANSSAPSTPAGWNFQNLTPVPNFVASTLDANQTLTATGQRIFNATPSANRTFTLPSATTKLGDQFVMYNISTTSNIAVVAADATPVCTIYPQSTATMSSLAATTSTNTNWSTSLGPQTGFFQGISSNATLTIYSNRRIVFNPTTSVTITMPSTGVPFGDVWQLYNSSFTNTITINASDATTITILYPQCRSFLNATVASPATFTSWFASSISTTNVYGLTGGSVSTAGTIGENTSASASAVSATTSGNYGDIASMTLQSGIWSLSCNFVILTQSLTTTAVSFGMSTNPGNNSSGLVSGQNLMPCYVPPASGITCGGSIGSFIVNPATGTTYYFKYTTSWATTAPLVSGSISAIRVG